MFHRSKICAAVLLAALQSSVFAQDNPAPLRDFFVATHFNRAALKNNKQPQWDVDRLIPQIKAMGAWGVRDGTSWSSIEKVKGQYVLPEADRHWVNQATSAGLKVIFVLLYDNKLYDNPTDPDAFSNYAAFVARSFKDNPNVVAFEIWNEPGNFFFRKQYGGEWNAKGEAPWLGKFAELVAKSSAAIKKENPNVKVIAGPGVPPPMYHMLERYPEAFKNLDGLVEHPYTYKYPPEVVAFGGQENLERDGVASADDKHSLVSLLKGESDLAEKKTGRRLPVWVTEFGFGTHVKQKKQNLYAGYTDQAQAAYHARALIQGLSAGVGAWTVYDFIDDGTDSSNPEHNFGLIRYSGEPKPAHAALRNVAQQLGPNWKSLGAAPDSLQAEFDPKIHNGKDPWAGPVPDPYVITGPQVYWFQVPDGYVTFVWNAGRINTELRPPVASVTYQQSGTPASAELVNLCTGEKKSLKLTNTNGQWTVNNVPVGGEPVAVKWNTK
ncbi:MAG: cellulase family glycosylhydrolase [Tepidisphaeraceae bacterium]